jgi:hypothetical protein
LENSFPNTTGPFISGVLREQYVSPKHPALEGRQVQSIPQLFVSTLKDKRHRYCRGSYSTNGLLTKTNQRTMLFVIWITTADTLDPLNKGCRCSQPSVWKSLSAVPAEGMLTETVGIDPNYHCNMYNFRPAVLSSGATVSMKSTLKLLDYVHLGPHVVSYKHLRVSTRKNRGVLR